MSSLPKLYTYKEERLNLENMSKRCGILKSTLESRIHAGWSIERATNTPVHKNKRYKYRNKLYTKSQLADLAGLTSESLRARLKKGWTVKEAVEIPIQYNGRKVKLYVYRGRELSIRQLIKLVKDRSITSDMLIYRLRNGWSVVDAVECKLNEVNPHKLPSVSKIKSEKGINTFYKPLTCGHQEKGKGRTLLYMSGDRKAINI